MPVEVPRANQSRVYDFTITLLNTNPAIWRRIHIPENYTFRDLHVAIQDSMGWLDCHLLEVLSDPEDEGYEDFMSWLGGSFDSWLPKPKEIR